MIPASISQPALAAQRADFAEAMAHQQEAVRAAWLWGLEEFRKRPAGGQRAVPGLSLSLSGRPAPRPRRPGPRLRAGRRATTGSCCWRPSGSAALRAKRRPAPRPRARRPRPAPRAARERQPAV